jgi:hypothetical protein
MTSIQEPTQDGSLARLRLVSRRFFDWLKARDDQHYLQVIKVHGGLDGGGLVQFIVLALHFGDLPDQDLSRKIAPGE